MKDNTAAVVDSRTASLAASAEFATSGEGPAARRSGSAWRAWRPGPTVRVWLLFVVLLGFYFALSPSSINVLTMNHLMQNAAPLVLVGVAQMIVLVGGQIDLSVGSVLGLSTTIVATKMHDSWWSVIGIAVAVIAVGASLGAANGLMISYRGLNSFVVTLATWSIISGLALFVLPSAGGATPATFTNLVNTTGPLSFGAYVLAAMAGIWLWARSSGAFVQLKAVGAAPDKVIWTGVRRRRVIALAFVLSAVLAAVAGLMLAGVTASGDPTIGITYILDSVAASVIGGVSLFGGRGSVVGVIGGALVLTVVNNVVFALGFTSYVTPAIIGLMLVLAVVLTGVGVRNYR